MKTVAITGATAGIGRATALRFDKAGYRVAAYGRNPAALDSLREELGPDAVVAPLDVVDADAWRTRMTELGGMTGGRLDVLVNNAGILASGPFAEIPLEEQQQILSINVGGMLNGCHVAYPLLKATPGASVINLSSASAIYGQPELATYSATKFAIRGLTEALELEWAPDDITVSAIWPLFVDTGMVQGVDTASTRSLGVSLTADDVADTILAVARGRQRLPHSVHHAVGRQAKGLMALSGVAPGWFMREVNRHVTRSAGH
ncbi:SDR family oxidoreductase [Nocardioides montaniterrae]